MTPECGATFALANGESVSPCHLNEGHAGEHKGFCLGSVAVWTSDKKHDSEEEQYWSAITAKDAQGAANGK